jgi:hypothetical protein
MGICSSLYQPPMHRESATPNPGHSDFTQTPFAITAYSGLAIGVDRSEGAFVVFFKENHSSRTFWDHSNC